MIIFIKKRNTENEQKAHIIAHWHGQTLRPSIATPAWLIVARRIDQSYGVVQVILFDPDLAPVIRTS